MKKFFIVVLIGAFSVTGCSSKKEPAAKIAAGGPAYLLAKDLAKVLPALNPDKPAVLISTKKFDVTAADVIQMFQYSMGNRAAQLKEMDAARLKNVFKQAARQLGERKLLLEAANQAKTAPPPEEIKAALEAQYAQAGGEQPYLETLKTNGMAIDFVKKSVTEDTIIRKYLEGIMTAAGKVTDEEIQKAYHEDKTASVRHILLMTQDKTDAQKEEIRKKMDDILARAKKGEDFAALAKQYTEDTGSKENGGLYEDFERGKMVKPFEDAAFSVPVGQISGLVETEFGYHILKVEGRKKETQPLDQVKSQIEARLKERKQMTAFEAHMTKLKESAKFKAAAL
jgi:parvulin-like peptidyl-prolyl isomerase